MIRVKNDWRLTADCINNIRALALGIASRVGPPVVPARGGRRQRRAPEFGDLQWGHTTRGVCAAHRRASIRARAARGYAASRHIRRSWKSAAQLRGPRRGVFCCQGLSSCRGRESASWGQLHLEHCGFSQGSCLLRILWIEFHFMILFVISHFSFLAA